MNVDEIAAQVVMGVREAADAEAGLGVGGGAGDRFGREEELLERAGVGEVQLEALVAAGQAQRGGPELGLGLQV